MGIKQARISSAQHFSAPESELELIDDSEEESEDELQEDDIPNEVEAPCDALDDEGARRQNPLRNESLPMGSFNMYEGYPSQDVSSPTPFGGFASIYEGATESASSRAVAVSTKVVANRALIPAQEFGQAQSQIALETAPRDPFLSPAVSLTIIDAAGQKRPRDPGEELDELYPPPSRLLRTLIARPWFSLAPVFPTPFRMTIHILRMMRGSCLWPKKTKTVDKMFSTSLAVGSVVSISPTTSSLRSRGIHLQSQQFHFIVLPSMESRLEEPDLDRRKLYALVLGHLVSTQSEMLTKKKYDQSRCPFLRRALVGLTGVWDLISAEEDMAAQAKTRSAKKTSRRNSRDESIFSHQDLVDAKRQCWMPELQEKDGPTTAILNDLIETTKEVRKTGADLTKVLKHIYRKIGTTEEQLPFLLVLMTILHNIVHPHHGESKGSEADSMVTWANIFKFGVPVKSPFRFNLGDQAIRAATRSKHKLHQVYGTGGGVRKGDCITKAGKVELNNFEAKKVGSSDIDVLNQRSKGFKITRSIMMELRKRFQMDCPPGLAIHGLTADVVSVREWRDINVAGRACPKLIILTTEDDWLPFLEYQAHVVKNLLKLYDDMASDVMNKIAAEKYLQQIAGEPVLNLDDEDDLDGDEEDEVLDGDDDDEEEGDGDLKHEVLGLTSLVFHTPTKCSPEKNRFLVAKPDNLRFRQQMHAAAKEVGPDI